MGGDLEAKFAITEVIYRYCRALDRMDRELADTIWHPGGTADYGESFKGTGAGFLDQVWVGHAQRLGHSHQVTNILIEVDGDRAGSESYVTARLWNRSDAGEIVQLVAVGRYVDRWSRRDGVWAIDHRHFVDDLVYTTVRPAPADAAEEERLVSAGERDPRLCAGRRDRSDPSYEVLTREPRVAG